MKRLTHPGFFLLVAFVTVQSFVVGDLEAFQRPELARIFFWHFPCPMVATVLLVAGAIWSVVYLRTQHVDYDLKAFALNELAFVWCLLTMITGMIFSRAQWGAWWQNDPRQTSFLLVLLIYFAYFAMRSAYTDPIRRATNSSGYAAGALPAALFLIFVFPRLPQIESFHPSDSIMKGNVKGNYFLICMELCVLMGYIAYALYKVRLRSLTLEYNLEQSDGSMETPGGAPAPRRVVRSIPLPGEDAKDSRTS